MTIDPKGKKRGRDEFEEGDEPAELAFKVLKYSYPCSHEGYEGGGGGEVMTTPPEPFPEAPRPPTPIEHYAEISPFRLAHPQPLNTRLLHERISALVALASRTLACQFPMPFHVDSYGWHHYEFQLALSQIIATTSSRDSHVHYHHRGNHHHRQQRLLGRPTIRIYFLSRSVEDPVGCNSPWVEVDEDTRLDMVFEGYFHRAYPGLPIRAPQEYFDPSTGEPFYARAVDMPTGTLGGKYYYRDAKWGEVTVGQTEWWGRATGLLDNRVWVVGCDRVPRESEFA